MAVKAYKILGVLLLAVLAWADFRGWAAGTEQAADEPTEQSSQSRTIRNRSYRGGK